MSEEMTKEQQEAMDKAFVRSMPEGLRKVQNEYSNVKKVIRWDLRQQYWMRI